MVRHQPVLFSNTRVIQLLRYHIRRRGQAANKMQMPPRQWAQLPGLESRSLFTNRLHST
jgi:hypothetical protein